MDYMREPLESPEVTNPSTGSHNDDDMSEDEAVPDGPPYQGRAADRRNTERVVTANRRDQELVGKYLTTTVASFLPSKLTGPDDYFVPSPDLIEAVRKVSETKVETPKAPPFRFDVAPESVAHNSKCIQDHPAGLQGVIGDSQDTTLGYGSEFRPLDQLESILGDHPDFPFLADILTNGMDYRFEWELSEEQRKEELTATIERGNHKSARDEPERLEKALNKDVHHGFAVPVLLPVVEQMDEALVQPAGMTKQFTLNTEGLRVAKYRLTHDLSCCLTADEISVNDRVDMSQYPDMIYGWCLSRVIHFIVALRLAHPDTRIYIAKYDYSDAYHRILHSATAAVRSILVLANVAYIYLRLTFGGSPNPPTWCAFSEMVTDLSNELSLCQGWDPATLHGPDAWRTTAPDTPNTGAAPAKARELTVNIPTTVSARTDSFIDDLIKVFLDTRENWRREPETVPLAAFVTSRPHAGAEEPVPRRDLISSDKLEAEGTPEEAQIVLGWLLDTFSLLISLPLDKHTAWDRELKEMIDSGRAKFGDLDSMVGRLNHASYLIPLARHFLH